MSAIQNAIATLTAGNVFSEDLALRVAGEILSGDATGAQIGSFLTALRIRGETAGHLMAFARTLRQHAAPVAVADAQDLVDTCGTGGDLAGTFNISTAAALIAAGAGARVAKHGNRAVTGRTGSADVLKALGVNIEMTAEVAARCLTEAGITFLLAPSFHSAMKHAAAPRREIGIRTIFNLLGPLANPAGAARQLIGVCDRHLMRPFAEALEGLGATRAMVVHGSDGLDEITLTGPTDIMEINEGRMESYSIEPEDFGIARVPLEALQAGTTEASAATIRGILAGEHGPAADIAALNAAAALTVAGRANSIADGLKAARRAIAEGKASGALKRLIEISNGGAQS